MNWELILLQSLRLKTDNSLPFKSEFVLIDWWLTINGSHLTTPSTSTPSTPTRTITELFPHYLVSPFYTVGQTDGRWYYQLTDHVYRFCPFFATAVDMKRFHVCVVCCCLLFVVVCCLLLFVVHPITNNTIQNRALTREFHSRIRKIRSNFSSTWL